ncbi:MAG: DUF5110 domain-containing protein [Kiritimatiellae bacterium]|nr:DUF5110 domain-containing protein [Kiritimatiellia bacterium]
MKTTKALAVAICLAAASATSAVKESWYSPRTVRIVKMHPDAKATEPTHPFRTVVAEPLGLKPSCAFDVSEKDGALVFSADGRTILSEFPATFMKRDYNGVKDLGAAQGWHLAKDEVLYGLGDNQTRELDIRHWKGRLMPGNVGDGLAAVVSPRGWAILWDNTSPVKFGSDDRGFSFESEIGDAVDYYFINAGSIDGCIAEIRMLTGDVPMMPRWVYGFWQSKERYKTQKETVGVVRKYRELGIPLDGIVQDWQYWGNNYLWNGMEFMNEDFRDPKRMVDEVHAMGAKIMISIWQSFGPQTKPYRELAEKGLLFPFETWPQSGIGHIWPPRKDYPSGARLYDNYSPVAREIYCRNLKRLVDLGIDAWWMDSTDPDHIYKEGDFECMTSLGCTWRAVRSAYPVSATEAVYENMRKNGDGRVFILTRGAGLGEQRYAASVWSGDVASNWDVLRRQIPGGLNYTMTGNPNFNCDLGGFFAGRYNRGGGVDNENWRELYVRWMQLGTFLPMMRSHGTDVPREIYLYGKAGEPVYDALVEAVKFRYLLMPYIYSTAAAVSMKRESFMRPLAADFPDDAKALKVSGEFMLGRSLLVAPVLKAMYTSEDNKPVGEMEGWNNAGDGESGLSKGAGAGVVYSGKKVHEAYLPKGADWWYVPKHGASVKYAGGETVKIEVDLNSQPCFIKAGGIMPIGPKVQYNGEKAWDDLIIAVAPGADGEFELYEDDFETYACERGEYSVIPFSWDDSGRTLTIGARKGFYPGMIGKRVFRILAADDESAIRTVEYTGEAVEVKL